MQLLSGMKPRRPSYLEKAAAETRVMEIQNGLKMIASDISIQEKQLRILLNDTIGLSFVPAPLDERVLANLQDSTQLSSNPLLAYAKQRFDIANAEKSVQSAKMLPDLSVGYFNLSLIGSPTANVETLPEPLIALQVFRQAYPFPCFMAPIKQV